MIARIFTLCVLSGFVSLSAGWEMFTDMRDAPKAKYEPNMVHSMYSYGDCNRHGIVLYTHVHLEAIDILGKLIVRGWLDIKRIPTCIILKAVSYERELFQNTLQNFQFCVPRISYCHSHKRFKYYFFECHTCSSMLEELCDKFSACLQNPLLLGIEKYLQLSSGWSAFTAIEDKGDARAEYVYGDCDFSKDMMLYDSVHITAADMSHKVILRGHLEKVKRHPSCVVLRTIGKNDAEVYQNTILTLQICIVRLTFIFSRRRHNLFIYELYIPAPGFASKVDYELTVYGTKKPLDF